MWVDYNLDNLPFIMLYTVYSDFGTRIIIQYSKCRPKFDPNLETWKHFVQRLNFYFIEEGIDESENNALKRKTRLCRTMGISLFNKYCDIHPVDVENATFGQIVGRIETIVNPRTMESMYRGIFNHEFNLEFHKPKQERCDICEEFKNNKEDVKFQQHVAGKIATKAERDRDRKMIGADSEAIVCFDLENVLSCPRANISNFSYKRKLSVYHLTAHCSKDKRGYGAIWCESTAGRSGNDLASALVSILDMMVKEHPRRSKFILWSDSCISQNLNNEFCSAKLYALTPKCAAH
jgi:hypothetical protein